VSVPVPFARDDAGRLVMTLHAGDLGVLVQLVGEIRELVQDPPGDNPAIQRLFPRAYLDPTEDTAEAEWQSVVYPDLVRERIAALDAIRTRLEHATADADEARVALPPGEEDQLLTVLNDVRLALGAALGIESEDDYDTDLWDDAPDPPGGADPLRSQYHRLLTWLGLLQEELVGVLLDELPDAGA
jgi:hypothetical protein